MQFRRLHPIYLFLHYLSRTDLCYNTYQLVCPTNNNCILLPIFIMSYDTIMVITNQLFFVLLDPPLDLFYKISSFKIACTLITKQNSAFRVSSVDLANDWVLRTKILMGLQILILKGFETDRFFDYRRFIHPSDRFSDTIRNFKTGLHSVLTTFFKF